MSLPIGDDGWTLNIPLDGDRAVCVEAEDIYPVEADFGWPAVRAFGQATVRPSGVGGALTGRLFANLLLAELRGRVRVMNLRPVDQEIDAMWLAGAIERGEMVVVPCRLRTDGTLVYVPLTPAILRGKLHQFAQLGGDCGSLAAWGADGVRRAVEASTIVGCVANRCGRSLVDLADIADTLRRLPGVAGCDFRAFDDAAATDGAEFSIPEVSIAGS
jgi:hypothetical protein